MTISMNFVARINIMVESYLSQTLEILMILSSISVFTLRNPVHSIFSLIFTFVLSVVYITLLGGEYIGLMVMIIYVGALAIIFLFVVMLLEIKSISVSLAGTYPLAGILSFILSSQLIMILNLDDNPYLTTGEYIQLIEWLRISTPVMKMGEVIYVSETWYIITASLILLIAMIGAIVLTFRNKGKRSEDIYQQGMVRSIKQ